MVEAVAVVVTVCATTRRRMVATIAVVMSVCPARCVAVVETVANIMRAAVRQTVFTTFASVMFAAV